MSLLPRALPTMVRTDLLTMIQYRGESVLWAFWGILYPAVAMAMWQAASDEPAEGSRIVEYGREGFAAYFLLVMIVGHLTAAWDAYEFGYFIRSGALSGWLMAPLTPIWRALSSNLSYKIFTMAILTPIWLGLTWYVKPRLDASAAQVALGLVALLLGAGIAFIWGYIVALAAFWTTRTDAIGEFWFGAAMLFGGNLAPVELLPTPLRIVAMFLPHAWMVNFPAEALIGRVPVDRLLLGLAAQAAWLVGGIVIFKLTWNAAVKRYSAVGG